MENNKAVTIIEQAIKNGVSNDEIQAKVNEFIEQNIFAKLHNIDEKLDEIRSLSRRSKDTGGFFRFIGNKATFGIMDDGSKKRDELLADMNELNAEATRELANIVQSSIGLTCGSIKYTEYMIDTMGGMLTDGFTTRDGRILELSEESKQSVISIIESSKKHVARLKANEEKVANIEKQALQNSKRLDEKDMLDDKQSKDIRANAINISSNKTRLDEKDSLDTEQSRQIAKLESEISKLKNNGLISIVSLIVSVLALGIAIFTLTKIL
ncbi:hypothetical protein [Campylobacter sp. CN_NA1]|uniref:hypothetical protein n=1 Tax=Campylobacter sp. CN_NA1 TaxID=2984150 RepID=UPI0022E9D7E4|nr:hypothetical protein [Campylobacter sp. CN_NA1]MDA3055647.1 hypothetical protein [Campylobacter sp. CN_NA1]